MKALLVSHHCVYSLSTQKSETWVHSSTREGKKSTKHPDSRKLYAPSPTDSPAHLELPCPKIVVSLSLPAVPLSLPSILGADRLLDVDAAALGAADAAPRSLDPGRIGAFGCDHAGLARQLLACELLLVEVPARR
jgi:hypothetical protein